MKFKTEEEEKKKKKVEEEKIQIVIPQVQEHLAGKLTGQKCTRLTSNHPTHGLSAPEANVCCFNH